MLRGVALIALLPIGLRVSVGAAAVAIPASDPNAEPTLDPGLVEAVEAAPRASPAPTAAPVLPRGLGDDIKSFVGSLASHVESDVKTFVESGLLDFPNGFPIGTAVQKALGVSDSDLAPLPTQVLNIPAFANWTSDGWNVRVHGNVYKVPDVDQRKIDDLANVFLIGTDVDDLNSTEKAQARNLTRSIFVVQQPNVSVTMDFVPDMKANAGGAIAAKGGAQKVRMPYNTTTEGDFDAFIKLRNTTGGNGRRLIPGNATSRVQTLNMYAEGTDTGNASVYLVPEKGLTIVSDIDDILRVTKIYEPKEGLLNSFARPFTPWMNMPDIYANWSKSLDNLHFHYLTTTPEQATRNYMDFIYKTYPLGSFDTRPLNFSDTEATFNIRRSLLDKIFQTFPQRRFVLVADTSNSDVMKAYPAMYKDYPGQVACIFLRNTSATDDGDKFPYDTSGFEGIPKRHYMFFSVPNDLTNLDVANGQCLNRTVQQHVTFDDQGLPFGLGDDEDDEAASLSRSRFAAIVVGAVVTVSIVGFSLV